MSTEIIKAVPDLLLFCEPQDEDDEGRYGRAMQFPIVVGDWIYCTDAKIAVRAKKVFEKVPDVASIFATFDISRLLESQWEPWPDASYCGEETDCYECLTKSPCRVCNGECKWGCKACKNKGFSPRFGCPLCEGKGVVQQEQLVGNRTISRKYDQKIRSLGKVEWAVTSNDPNDPVCFRFDGGEGIVCPLQKS